MKKWKISGKDILGYLLLGISVIMLVRSLMLCFSNDIWYDELFTVGMVEHSCSELITFTARDVHPPLYYIITKIIVDLCKLISAEAETVIIAKIVSVLPYFILLIYSATLIRRRFGILTGGVFLFCSIAMPQLSSYTVEVRMYSWALLFVTAAFLHGYSAVHAVCAESAATYSDIFAVPHVPVHEIHPDGKMISREQKLHGAALVCYGLAAAYTQYFACVAVIMVYLYVLSELIRTDKGRIKEWLLWVVLSIIGYAPWLFALYSQIAAVSANYWILPLSWRTFGGCVKFLMKPAFANEGLNVGLAVLLFVIYVGVLTYNAIKLYHYRRENKKDAVISTDTANTIDAENNAGTIEAANTTGIENTIDKANTTGIVNTGDTADTANAASILNAAEAMNEPDVVAQVMQAHIICMLAGTGVLAGLVLFGYVASELVRPIFVYRYMIPAMGCFWLSLALGLDHMWRSTPLNVDYNGCDKKVFFKKTGVLPAAIVFLLLPVGLRDYRAFMGEEEYKILLMEETEAALSSISDDHIVIYNFDQVQAVTSYYLPEKMESYLWCGTPETLIQDIIRPYGVLEEAGVIKEWCKDGKAVWFIGSFNSRDAVVEEWTKAGLQVEETGSYLLERYWFNLYKISI